MAASFLGGGKEVTVQVCYRLQLSQTLTQLGLVRLPSCTDLGLTNIGTWQSQHSY